MVQHRAPTKIYPQDRVFLAVSKIPFGKVTTYGLLAELTGVRNPRVIGNYLHSNTDPLHYPCHRVVDRNGRLAPAYAFGGAGKQAQRLKDENVKVINSHVALDVYLWRPSAAVKRLFAD